MTISPEQARLPIFALCVFGGLGCSLMVLSLVMFSSHMSRIEEREHEILSSEPERKQVPLRWQ